MINLMYELGQARMADLHREAAAQHRAALVQASGTRRRWLCKSGARAASST